MTLRHRALMIRHRHAMEAIQHGQVTSESERWDLLTAVVAPTLPLLRASMEEARKEAERDAGSYRTA